MRARLAAWLRRLAERLAGGPAPARDGPPEPWASLVRERAPELLRPAPARDPWASTLPPMPSEEVDWGRRREPRGGEKAPAPVRRAAPEPWPAVELPPRVEAARPAAAPRWRRWVRPRAALPAGWPLRSQSRPDPPPDPVREPRADVRSAADAAPRIALERAPQPRTEAMPRWSGPAPAGPIPHPDFARPAGPRGETSAARGPAAAGPHRPDVARTPPYGPKPAPGPSPPDRMAARPAGGRWLPLPASSPLRTGAPEPIVTPEAQGRTDRLRREQEGTRWSG